MKNIKKEQTLLPLSMNLTAKSSLVLLSLTNLATPKFPDPISFTISYLSIKFQIGKHNKNQHEIYSLLLLIMKV